MTYAGPEFDNTCLISIFTTESAKYKQYDRISNARNILLVSPSETIISAGVARRWWLVDRARLVEVQFTQLCKVGPVSRKETTSWLSLLYYYSVGTSESLAPYQIFCETM